jgi:hypothetical protein
MNDLRRNCHINNGAKNTSGLLGFWTLSIVWYSKEHQRTQRFGNWTERDPVSETLCSLEQRSPTDGPLATDGPWRNLDIIFNFYVYYTVSLYYYIISNKQQQISH